MKLARDNLYVAVVEATEGEKQWLKRALRYHDKAGRFRGRSEVCVYDAMSDQFPAGLLPDVGSQAADDEVLLELHDTRDPAPPRSTPDLSWLDDTQREALQVALTYGRGLLQLPTGAGKTEIGIAVALTYSTARVLWLAPRTQLATQSRDRWTLRTGGAPSGLIAEGERSAHRVTFATFQAMHSALEAGDPQVLDLLRATEVLIADEAQTAAAKTFFPVLMRTERARVRLGLSATPLDRTDERGVYTIGALGPIVHTVKARELVGGRLVEPRVVMHRVKQFATQAHPRDTAPNRACVGCGAIGAEPCAGDCGAYDGGAYFRAVYDELVVRSSRRNTVIVDAAVAAEKPVVVFVRELAQARSLKVLLAKHMSIELVSGSKATAARDRVAKQLNRRDLDAAIATSVWEAGVDIPNLRTVINAGAGASDIRSVQVLGRVVRAAEGKDACTLVDIMDEGEGVLERHAHKRRRAYSREGWKVEVL